MAESSDLLVFITKRPSTCSECKEDLGKHAWITLVGDRSKGESNAVCLECADLSELVFLPSGDQALTRRAKKNSKLSAVVLEWSRARKRYERQGLLVEENALEEAESQCLEDADLRARKRARESIKREAVDKEYVAKFAEAIRRLYPKMPKGREQEIAEHACMKYSDRVGRSRSAKDLQDEPVHLAVRAHVRHAESDYDALLMRGKDRFEARQEVAGKVDSVLEKWSG